MNLLSMIMPVETWLLTNENMEIASIHRKPLSSFQRVLYKFILYEYTIKSKIVSDSKRFKVNNFTIKH